MIWVSLMKNWFKKNEGEQDVYAIFMDLIAILFCGKN